MQLPPLWPTKTSTDLFLRWFRQRKTQVSRSKKFELAALTRNASALHLRLGRDQLPLVRGDGRVEVVPTGIDEDEDYRHPDRKSSVAWPSARSGGTESRAESAATRIQPSVAFSDHPHPHDDRDYHLCLRLHWDHGLGFFVQVGNAAHEHGSAGSVRLHLFANVCDAALAREPAERGDLHGAISHLVHESWIGAGSTD